MLGDKGYDADWFRNALIAKGSTPCIPSKANRKVHIPHDQALHRQRHKVGNMFGKLKDWLRILTLRPMRPNLHVRHLHPCHRHLLAQSMSPEPRTCPVFRDTSSRPLPKAMNTKERARAEKVRAQKSRGLLCLAQERENVLLALIGLCQHRSGSLAEDLRLGERGSLGRVIRVLDP